MSVRTVHTSFTTTNEWTPMNKYPPGLGLSYPSAMSSSPSLTRRRSATFIDHNSNVVGNGIGLASHQLPPPPPRRRMPLSRLPYVSNYNPPTQQLKFDPFASDDAPSQAWASSKSSQKSPPPASHYTIQLPNLSTRSLPLTNNKPQQRPPPQPVPVAAPKPDRNARARIVAGILLNRIYAVGKPMRRRMASSFGSKSYVPSGLSSVVTVEC